VLSRKRFVTAASCVLCSLPGLAGPASAQSPAPTSGITRKILTRMDGPAVGYETVLVEAVLDAGIVIGRHTHPGIESAYLLEGGFELSIDGQPARVLKPGDGYQIPPGVAHAGGKAVAEKSRIIVTYVVEKGKPLSTPA